MEPATSRRFGTPAAFAGLVLAALTMTGPARGEDIPALLLAAAKAMPSKEAWTGTRRCASIGGVGSRGDADPAHAEPGAEREPPPYGPDASGAFLATVGPGQPASGFAQALLDAGAAVRLRKTRTVRSAMLNPGMPLRLRDLGTAGPAANAPLPPPTVSSEQVERTDVVLATGPAAAFLGPARPGMLAPIPPVADGATAPSRVFGAARVCWTIEAERVLEWADPRGERPRTTAARVLFRARLPDWMSDHRVTDALVRPMPQPNEVLDLFFRNDGDGWRVNGPSVGAVWDEPPRHIAAPEGDVPR